MRCGVFTLALLVLLGVAVAAGATSELGQATPRRKPDVVFQPTPMDIVRQMLEVARVGPSDVVYDLGSGDGRIVITAAREYGARGVGIDIDRDLVRDATTKARASGVGERVRFINQDLFEADFSEATVVTLYLLPALNLKLRPKLLALKPGTRIVSYAWHMGDWAPDKTVDVAGGTIYYWMVPARR